MLIYHRFFLLTHAVFFLSFHQNAVFNSRYNCLGSLEKLERGMKHSANRMQRNTRRASRSITNQGGGADQAMLEFQVSTLKAEVSDIRAKADKAEQQLKLKREELHSLQFGK
jgi:seryl-tRNA synthetase